MLRLAEVDVERLEELVTDSWRMRAPEALVRPEPASPERQRALPTAN
jgi:hypothetical protein